MKCATVRFPLLLLVLCAVVLSGCQRRSSPAEVIYRTQAPGYSGSAAAAPVEAESMASRPTLAAPSEQVTIGLIVPLTGSDAKIGTQLRDAALMALYDTIDGAPKLDATATPKLLMRDSGGNADASAKAAQELIDAGAQVILGPLVAKNVEAAGRVTNAHAVPLIAFSNNVSVARPGVYVFGFIPQQQVKRIADFAADQQIKHFAAIAQQDDYGRMVVRDFSHYLADHNLTVQPVEFFNKGGMPSSPILTRIANDAVDIGRERKAVFLPLTGKALSAVSLRFMQDIKANNGFLKLLGTGLWDNPQTLQDPGMKGAWFATTSPELSYEYNQRFFDQYGYAPSRIASLAYDAVALTASQGIQGGAQALSIPSLLKGRGFQTPANGGVKFNSDGIVDRALSVVEVGASGFRVIDSPKYSDR